MSLPKLSNEIYLLGINTNLEGAAESVKEKFPDLAEIFVARAQVLATMTLVYEQAETNRILRNRFRIPEGEAE